MQRTKEDFDKLSLPELLDDVMELQGGDLWDRMRSASNKAEIDIAYHLLKDKIIAMENALTELVAVIPKQTMDADWWPDELSAAIGKAKKIV